MTEKIEENDIFVINEKYCTNCGIVYSKNDKFCGSCGIKRRIIIPKSKRKNLF